MSAFVRNCREQDLRGVAPMAALGCARFRASQPMNVSDGAAA
ncbi:MAG: hypothetical protein RBU37_21540 [Myxococcota bacterium]|jgi:hypothetical protein|nr:hypothetical protein [Myxococcota bacterium]